MEKKTAKRASEGSETKAAKKVTAKATRSVKNTKEEKGQQEKSMVQRTIEYVGDMIGKEHADEKFDVQAARFMNTLLNATVTVVSSCARMMGKDGHKEVIHVLSDAIKQVEAMTQGERPENGGNKQTEPRTAQRTVATKKKKTTKK